ncbi:MAG TPA: MFS transporter, partial [Micromonospora sp.]|nr:MFS transporter [Micromonospora sp.]
MTDSHYFAAEPGTAANRRIIEFTMAGRDYSLVTAAGVFSGDRLDPG